MLPLLLACTTAPETPIVPTGTPTGPASPEIPRPTPDILDSPPDLVVFLVSGLRADIPGADASAPEARFWAAAGTPTIRWTHAYAQTSSTFLSLGSLFTGRYVSSIPLCGLFTDGVSAAEARTVSPNAEAERLWCANLPKGVPTVAEVLALYGYQTAFFHAGIPGADLLRRGFATEAEVAFGAEGTDWASLSGQVTAWWSSHTDAPRLLVVATADTDVTARPDVLARMGIHLSLQEGPTAAGADPADVLRIYGDEAERTGRRIGTLLGQLGGSRERWAFVGSTNGVSLVEPSGFFGMPIPVATTSYMLDRTARVPFGAYGPSPSATASRVVELLDLLPTLTRMAGAVPPAGLHGADLLLAPPDGTIEDTAYAEFGDTLLLRRGPYELLFRGYLHHGTVLDPQLDERLWDPSSQRSFSMHLVETDPYQADDLVHERSDDFNRMRTEMQRIRRDEASPPADTWDDPQRLWQIRMARSHGYW